MEFNKKVAVIGAVTGAIAGAISGIIHVGILGKILAVGAIVTTIILIWKLTV